MTRRTLGRLTGSFLSATSLSKSRTDTLRYAAACARDRKRGAVLAMTAMRLTSLYETKLSRPLPNRAGLNLHYTMPCSF